MSAMSLKDFRRLGKRDFANGAVLDEIEKALEQREDLLAACKAMLHDIETAEAIGDPCCVGSKASDAARAALSKAESP